MKLIIKALKAFKKKRLCPVENIYAIAFTKYDKGTYTYEVFYLDTTHKAQTEFISVIG